MSVAIAAAVVATSLRLVASHGYAEGAPPGFSGGFKEDSCHACHFHAELNSGPGRVTLAGVPVSFAPGEQYTVTIRLHRTGMELAGFQLTARFADSGAQAGTLAAGPHDLERVRVETYEGVQYADHRKAGTSVDGDEAAWTIVWTAPIRGGPVLFHVSANAADGNGNAEGDFIYTATATARAGEGSGRARAARHADGVKTSQRRRGRGQVVHVQHDVPNASNVSDTADRTQN